MGGEANFQILADAMQAVREQVKDLRAYLIDVRSLLTAGAVNVQNWPASLPVTGTFWPATQPVSGTVSVSNQVEAVSLGTAAGKSNVLRTGSLTSTATTADQVVHSYTVTTGKTFFIEYLAVIARLTTLSATASVLGTWSLESPAGNKRVTWTCTNPTTSLLTPFVLTFTEPLAVPEGVVVRVVATPAAATSMLWVANFGGYER